MRGLGGTLNPYLAPEEMLSSRNPGPHGSIESQGSLDRSTRIGEMHTSTCSRDLSNLDGCIPDLAKMSLETIAPGCTNPQSDATLSIWLSRKRGVQSAKLAGEPSRDSHGLVEYDPSGSKFWNAINATRTVQNTDTDESVWSRASCCSPETTTSSLPSDEDVEVMVNDDPLVTEDTQGDMCGRNNSRPKYTLDEKIMLLYLHVVLEHSWKVVAEQFFSYKDREGQKPMGSEGTTKRTISGLQSEAYRLFGCKEWNLIKRRKSIPGGNRDAINKNRFRQKVKLMKKEGFVKRLEEKFKSPGARL